MKRPRDPNEQPPSGGNLPKKPANTAGGMPKVKDALGYLEKVKNKFASRPQIYNQFLDIMKEFKSQSIDTEGVIKRVKTLFKGNRSLILGFNQFLPPGYKIELPPEKPPEPRAKPNIEFNHAVQYVAKIKSRFKNEPQIYTEFLDILHEYQAKRTIEEVYGRVQRLFGNEPDLLDEFRFFLPDATPAPAQKASAGVKRPAPPTQPSARPATIKVAKKSDKQPVAQPAKKAAPAPTRTAGAQQRSGGSSSQVQRPEEKKKKIGIQYAEDCAQELTVLDKMKQTLSKSLFNQFMKILNLFGEEVINRFEMVRLVEDLLGDKYAELSEKFKASIDYREWDELNQMSQEHSSYHAFLNTHSFQKCPQATPSYRELPSDLPVPVCSNRSSLAETVLNDSYISLPTGSEDFSFKSTRKNMYEENLFRCEDERYELDMLIETNSSVVKVLEPLAKDIASLSMEQAKNFKLPKEVDVIHQKSIMRMYGEHGPEILDLLKKSPATAIPVILVRAKQKDDEWRRLRNENKSIWRKVAEQNYHKSLDHRSFYFKQEDKKRLSSKALVTHLRDVHNFVFGEKRTEKEELFETEALRQLEGNEGPQFNYCMRFAYPDASIHEDIYNIVAHMAESTLSSNDVSKVLFFFSNFVHHFFGVNVEGKPSSRPPPARTPRSGAGINTRARDRSGDDSDSDEEDRRLKMKKEVADVDIPVPKEAKALSQEHMRQQYRRDEVDTDKDEPLADESSKHSEGGVVSSAESDGEELILRVRVPYSRANRERDRAEAASKEKEEKEKPAPSPTPSASQSSNVLNLSLPSPKAETEDKEQVKPVRIMMDIWQLEDQIKPVRKHVRPSKLFFCNNTIYVFFRLHQYLYHRLLKAKTLAYKHKIKNVNDPSKKRGKRKKRRPDPTSKEEAHEQFKALLYELLDEEVDSNRFEDECRALLGANSYVLYTIDKLIFNLVKQVQSIVNTPSCIKLMELYSYEFTRARQGPMTEDRSGQLVHMYHNNAAVLFGEESGVQIEYFEDSSELAIGLVEGSTGSEAQNVTSDWSLYMDHYLMAPVGPDNAPRQYSLPEAQIEALKGPILKRNICNSRMQNPLHHVEMMNGLEAKICARTYKVQYVEETEDVFIRHGRLKLSEPFDFPTDTDPATFFAANPLAREVYQRLVTEAKQRRKQVQSAWNHRRQERAEKWLQATFDSLFPEHDHSKDREFLEDYKRPPSPSTQEVARQAAEARAVSNMAGLEMAAAAAVEGLEEISGEKRPSRSARSSSRRQPSEERRDEVDSEVADLADAAEDQAERENNAALLLESAGRAAADAAMDEQGQEESAEREDAEVDTDMPDATLAEGADDD